MKFPRLLPACLLFLSVLLLAEPAPAQQTLGVVTALKGEAQLTRAAARSPLRFKDSLVLRDIIDTREKSLVRILFGGKSTVTVRELSRLEIREETLPGGATRSIHELSSGGVLVKVARELMRPGDEVQIRTPNAVAAVRGTTIFAFFDPILKHSQFACLTGVCSVTPLGLPSLTLTANLTIAVTGDRATGVQAGTVQGIGAAQSTQIQQQFDTGPAVTQEANRQRAAQAQLQVASRLANAVLARVAGGSGDRPTTPAATASAADGTTAKAPLIAGGTGEAISQSFRTPPEIILAGVNITLAPFETLKTFDQSGTFNQTPFILVNGSTVTQTGPDNLIQIDPGVTATFTGQLLDANNSTLSAGADFLSVKGSLTSLAGNGLLGFNTSTASAGTSLVNVGGSLTVSGPLVSANQSNLTPTHSLLFAGGGATVTGNGTSPFLSITNNSAVANSMTTPNPLIDLGSGSLTLAGPLFRMQNNSTVTAASDFLKLDGTTLVSTSGAPLLQFADSTADIGGRLFLASALSSSQIDVAGTVLKSENSDLTVSGDLFFISNAQLQTSSDQPIALVKGGNLSVGGSSPFALFNVSGASIDSMGLGTDQPIKGSSTPFSGALNPIGGLFKATNGATIDVAGNAIRFDTVLFEATQPLIELIGGSPGMPSEMTTGLATEEFSASKIVALGPITSLDNSLITVNSGPFLSLTDGTNMTVTGDLLRLMNGSIIKVVNGPLIHVDGLSSKGFPSTLDVSGALVNFVGVGNKIVVNNTITPNLALAAGGIPVSGSNITITGSPIRNSAGGSILINNDAVGVASTFTGSLIETTNGGVVNITGAP